VEPMTIGLILTGTLCCLLGGVGILVGVFLLLRRGRAKSAPPAAAPATPASAPPAPQIAPAPPPAAPPPMASPRARVPELAEDAPTTVQAPSPNPRARGEASEAPTSRMPAGHSGQAARGRFSPPPGPQEAPTTRADIPDPGAVRGPTRGPAPLPPAARSAALDPAAFPKLSELKAGATIIPPDDWDPDDPEDSDRTVVVNDKPTPNKRGW
jgi:hypothetical protein